MTDWLNLLTVFKVNGVNGGPAAEVIVGDMAKTSQVKVAMGWGPESQYVADVSAAGMCVELT